jgi:hypothetical protein
MLRALLKFIPLHKYPHKSAMLTQKHTWRGVQGLTHFMGECVVFYCFGREQSRGKWFDSTTTYPTGVVNRGEWKHFIIGWYDE